LRVSHETIYRSLFIQARGVLKKELMQHLRSQRRIRHSRHSSVGGQSRGQIVDAISIRERPAEAEDGAVPGHWEGDLLSGAHNSHVATLVERRSRFVLLVTSTVGQLPATLRRSLTWDRGLEMAHHQSFTIATDVKVCFCGSAESLATRQQRKYQWALTAVPAEEGRLVQLQSIGPGPNRAAPKSAPTQDVGL
jgi:IS30 family transposase